MGETFAPVANMLSVRIFLAICPLLGVGTAFLNAYLDEPVYMHPPDEYALPPGKEGCVLKLVKALYGLKQSPRAWNRRTLDT